MFARFFREGRLRRVERKLKRLHAKQRRLRERTDAAEREARSGGADAKARVEKLAAEREALVRAIADLTHEERELKAELAASD